MKRREKRDKRRDRRKKGRKRDRILLGLILLSALLIILLLCLLFGSYFGKKQPAPPLQEPPKEEPAEEEKPPEEPIEEAPKEEEPKEEEKEEEAEEKEYPQPEYDFQTEEVTVKIPGLSRAYTLAWVSDLHLIADHEAGDVKEEFIETVKERYETLSITKDGVHGEELWPEIVKFLNIGKFDAVILGGDLMDYYSSVNMEAFLKEYRKIEAKTLYIRADHDYGFWYGGEELPETLTHELHKQIDGDDPEEKYLDFGEFMVIGVNGSTKDMLPEQKRILQELYDEGKPVIAVTHVPYWSEVDGSLEELSMAVRGKIYYWGGGDYVPNEVTQSYLDNIYREDTQVKQVLAGHLHAKWDGMLTQETPQHIFSPAYEGVIGVVHVVPA